MTNKVEDLEKAAKDVIDDFDGKPLGLKRSNSLTVLAQKFSAYEKLCLELADKSESLLSFEPGTRVTFIETQENGTVSSINEHFVFVKFDRSISNFGIENTTAQACSPDQLSKIKVSS
ncbi:hypothetical protein KAU33_15975 [Candidatus Dependentiae bacterium]|nr:hypothetical protein [Candidatus Dependentiae bacterium]